MPMLEKYRHYFNIDPDYFPAVNEAVITKNPEVWKKFFPHETFVKLLKNTVSVLERKQKLCLWVEGAYGTGKSHAVQTRSKSCWFQRRRNPWNTSRDIKWTTTCTTASRP